VWRSSVAGQTRSEESAGRTRAGWSSRQCRFVPNHYSRDITQRCRALIRHLHPVVQNGLPEDERFGGPLDTTFLLALATPMIVLPVERIFKPMRPGADVPADDREIDPALADRVADVLGPGRPFADAPFAASGRWSYFPAVKPFSLAAHWPYDLLEALASEQATAEADRAPAQRIALAHGGVTYLDARGHQTYGQAAMLAFASVRTDRARVTGFNILRVHQDHFFEFLMAWADWLSAPRIAGTLSRQHPLAA
jgi:hypothetical protein